jgi:hypothetical protein
MISNWGRARQFRSRNRDSARPPSTGGTGMAGRRTGRDRRWRAARAGLAGATLAALLCCGAGSARGSDKIVKGDSTIVAGGEVSTWARVNGNGEVIWVGTTMPMEMIEDMPPAPGDGPRGAELVLDYPQVAQATTYFNHLEIHSNPNGHETPPGYLDARRYGKAHFDLHFYSVPVDEVWGVPDLPLPLPDVPADLLPAGWAQPRASRGQMGRHAFLLSEYTAPAPWLLTMVAGFMPDGSYMHFLEPMITREFLLQRQNFTMPVPRPQRLGRPTRYPTELVGYWDKDANAYQIVFKGFEWMQ